ncbi:hypothetical protein Pyn_21686 [Prunus yedoensis var. nudiflora]|uniref:MYB transcription factor n=1 Tax=Prunus yedoensis var. nudiflora TaxID=2094558 RepID=A0A314USK4_PRUYE|nr:hypothetical protein Pyn_21686 [Prunus yedoensis var. nudiflora]
MGNPKQKWTSEEEEALRAGVKKHGTGKWKDIQKDPEFNPFLSSRSNIDLKDKWRNMTVSGMNPRDKSRAPKAKANVDAPAASVSISQTSAAASAKRDAPAAATATARRDAPAVTPARRDAPAATPARRDAPAATPVRHDAPAAPVADDSSTGLSDAKTAPAYDAMIFEALSTSTGPNGLDSGAIASFIEIQNCYRTKAPKQKDIHPIEESAVAAAYKIADAENKSFVAAEAVKEFERLSEMAEEAQSTLQAAAEILEKCSEGEVLLMA